MSTTMDTPLETTVELTPVPEPVNDDVQKFSFIEWVQKTYPVQDDADERKKLLQYFCQNVAPRFSDEESQVYFSLTHEILADLLSCVSSMMGSGQIDEDSIVKLCESMENIKQGWIDRTKRSPHEKSDLNLMDMENGYFLNVSSLPTAVKFWKSLITRRTIPRNRRMLRSSFESEYKSYATKANVNDKFSHVLFSLSWMGLLRVYNNSLILFNNRSPMQF